MLEHVHFLDKRFINVIITFAPSFFASHRCVRNLFRLCTNIFGTLALHDSSFIIVILKPRNFDFLGYYPTLPSNI